MDSTAHNEIARLSRLLHDPDPGVRGRAILALGDIGGPEARQILESVRDRSSRVRECLAQAAGKVGSLSILKRLVQDGNRYVRFKAVRAMGNLMPDAVGDLLEMLVLPYENVVTEALDILQVYLENHDPPPGALSVISQIAMRHPAFPPRSAATRVLGYLGEQAIPYLLVLVNDKDFLIQRAASESLGRIGPAGVRALLSMGTSQNAVVAAALAYRGDWEAFTAEEVQNIAEHISSCGGSHLFCILSSERCNFAPPLLRALLARLTDRDDPKTIRLVIARLGDSDLNQDERKHAAKLLLALGREDLEWLVINSGGGPWMSMLLAMR